MNMILNEKKYVETMIALEEINPKELGHTVSILTRYMCQEGHTKKEIYSFIEEFITASVQDFDINNWYSFIDKCINKAKKRDLLVIDYIPITKIELKTIRSIKNPAKERLLFTILVLAKFNNLKSETNNSWVNYPMNEFFKLARVACSVSDRPHVLYELKEAGFIEIGKKISHPNIRVTYNNDDSEVILKITDLRELGYQYQLLDKKTKIKLCKRCRKPYKVKSSKANDLYCSDCKSKKDDSGAKTIICQSCGTEFPALSKNNRATLCPECQRQKKNEANKIFMEKMRKK